MNLITGDIKTRIDAVWDSFWSGGISNALEVIEQIACSSLVVGIERKLEW